MCSNIVWGGSTGSTLTLHTASGSFSPNPVTLTNGSQVICFTYTDLAPHSGSATFYFSMFDPATGLVCRDSISRSYRACIDSCNFGVLGM
ncbi:MAG: hypothetical protein M3Q97_10900, partial [Bacteroidota bacterium]|nr:hypothetical protein [Bacteroidota bacterium]